MWAQHRSNWLYSVSLKPSKISENVNTARSYASTALTEAVEKGQEISVEMEDDYVSTEHLLLGLASVGRPSTFQQFLKNFNLSEKKIKEVDPKSKGRAEDH